MPPLTASFGRIVGNSAPHHWAQTFVLEQEEKATLLVAVVSVQTGEQPAEEEVDHDSAGTIGKAVLTALEETFGKQEDGSYAALEETLEHAGQAAKDAVENERASLDISIVAALLQHDALFVGLVGGGGILVKRGDEVQPILAVSSEDQREAHVKMASGRPNPGDRILLATDAFLSAVAAEVLDAALAEETLEDVADAITPILHKQNEGTGAAAVVLGIGEKDAPGVSKEEAVSLHQTPLPRLDPSSIPRLRRLAPSRFWLSVWVVGSVVLLGVIGLLAFMFITGRASPTEQDAQQKELTRLLSEAEDVLDLNPMRARALVEKAESIHATRSEDEGAESVAQRITALRDALRQTYDIETPPVHFEFRLIDDAAIADAIAVDRGAVMLLRQDRAALFQAELLSKQSSVIQQGVSFPNPSWVVWTNDQIYLLAADGRIGRVTTDQEVEMLRADKTWGEIADVEGYGGNIYLLDTGERAIWKYVPVVDGLSEPRHYLRGTSLLPEGAAGMAIDGSIWVVNRAGQVRHYLNGFQQDFALQGVSDPFVEVADLFTDADQKHLYLHDVGAGRVVVVDKQGEYRAQYSSPVIADAIQIIADESSSSLYILTSEKIFRIELQ